MNNTRPIFIGGAGRSGTTLIVDMLGQHPRISPIYETGFVIQLIDLLFGPQPLPCEDVVSQVSHCMDQWTRPLPLRPHNKRAHERYHHGPHYILFDRPFGLERTAEFVETIRQARFDEGLRKFLSSLFEEHCRLDNKPRWANKTPAYVHHLPLLRRLFPDMCFIHCVRDGRDVACSVVTRPWGPKTYSEAAAWWASKVTPGVVFARQSPGQCIEVLFEELVREPEESLGRILTWLGEQGDPAEILRSYQDGVVRIDPSRIGEWRRSFSPEDTREFRSLAGEMLDHFHYSD